MADRLTMFSSRPLFLRLALGGFRTRNGFLVLKISKIYPGVSFRLGPAVTLPVGISLISASDGAKKTRNCWSLVVLDSADRDFGIFGAMIQDSHGRGAGRRWN